jgi:single-strand DNA-binding protein
MASMAKVILIGNLGRDAELKYSNSGTPLLEFNLATNEKWNDRSGGMQEHTQWFRITLWGKQAETLKQYLTKGKQVFVDGKLRAREWTDKEGKNRTSLEVRADSIQLLGGRGGAGETGGGAYPQELEGDDPTLDDSSIPF